MKKSVALVGLLVLSLAVVPALAGAGKTHDMTAQVVSVDVKAKSITVKDKEGKSQTAVVLEPAHTRV